MNKGISDVKRILESSEPNTKKFALSHLYEIFSDTESNPIYDVIFINVDIIVLNKFYKCNK